MPLRCPIVPAFALTCLIQSLHLFLHLYRGMARSHRSPRYHPSTLVKIRGKWYVSVTKPKELQFGTDKQARRSTGTSDRRQAERLREELAQKIRDEFDRQLERHDAVFEEVRPILEAADINTRQWYTEGQITYRGKEHTWNVTNHVGLLRLASMLGMFQGKTISSRALSMVSDSDREWILEATKPNNLSVEATMALAAMEQKQKGLGEKYLTFTKHVPMIRLHSEEGTPDLSEDSDAPPLPTSFTHISPPERRGSGSMTAYS